MSADDDLLLELQAAARYTWHCRIAVVRTVKEAMRAIDEGAPICAAILQMRMPDGFGLDVAQAIEAAAPLPPPLLMLLDREADARELDDASVRWVRMPPNLSLLDDIVQQFERPALACAGARYAAGKGLSAAQRELFVLQTSGVRGAELRELWKQRARSRSAAHNTLSTYRQRIGVSLGRPFESALREARSLYELPLGSQPDDRANRGRRGSGTRLRSTSCDASEPRRRRRK